MESDILHKARDYEEQYGASIKDGERPLFHLTPRVGWMNDPNGFSVYQGKYHLFYQYHPYSLQWGPMHWGHAVSRDFLCWEYLPAAIAPDREYDGDGCFSGSALELEDGRQLLMYTGLKETADEYGTRRAVQRQCLAVGDGLDYEKWEANPVLDAKDLPEGFSAADFRDPKIILSPEGGYDCVVGNRTDDGSGAILLFHSDGGFAWRFVTVLDRCRNEYGRMWECPDFFGLDGKHIIMASPQDMDAQGTEFHNGNGTIFLVGSYDGERHIFNRERVQAVDYGLDFYAPQTLCADDGRRIMVAWMQNWDTCGWQPEGAKWFGQMTVPRELAVREGRVIQNPVRELAAYHGHPVVYADVPVQEEVELEGVRGRVIDMTVTVKAQAGGSYQWFRMGLAWGCGYGTFLSYCPETSVLVLDRGRSGLKRDFVHDRHCLVRHRGGEIKLRIILDRFSAEIFVNDGEQALSTTLFTPQAADGIRFGADGKALVSVEKYDIVM